MMRTKDSLLDTIDNKTSLILTIYLSLFLFWIGLGVGSNMSDTIFWIESTWMTIKLEWIFIFLYIVLSRRFFALTQIWTRYRFVSIVALLWLATIVLSYLLTPYYGWQNPLASMRLIETITHLLFFILLWDFFSQYDVDYRMIFTAIILSSLIVLGYFIYIQYTFPDLKADRHVFSMRSSKLILNTHVHRVGYQVEATIAFATAFILSKHFRYLSALIMGVLFLFLLWLGGRAAILGIVVALVAFILYFRKYISLKVATISVALFVVFVAISLYFNLFDLDYFSNALKKTLQADSIDQLLTGRIKVWSLVLKELQGHWILGTGPQSYIFYFGRNEDVIHAHNFVLQMLGEWGIVGTTLFGILLYRAISYGATLHLQHQPTYSHRYNLAAGFVILALTITGLFSSTYFFHQTSVYLIISYGLWVTAAKPI